MLVGIDGFEASVGERVGVGRLAVEVVRGLEKVDRKNKYRAYAPASSRRLVTATTNWQYRFMPHTRLWSQVTLPFYLFKDKPRPDVFLSPSHYAPRFCPCPSVIFIFDLAFLHFPKMFKKRDLYKLVNWTKYSVKKAAKVITISESTKADIINKYGVEENKVIVAYPGIIMKSKIQNPKSKILEKYGIDSDYILYVGTLQPRKNLVKLIEAFHNVKTHHTSHITHNLQLVIAGKKGWMYDEIFAKVKELGLEKEVTFTGFVPDDELPVIYKNAKLLALVSLYEGFGLPVLEAMSYGTPVVVSNVSSLPEVAGDAGVYVDPNDTKDIADKMFKILKMRKTEYKRLSDKCKKQANKFSWEKTARDVLEVLEEVADV